jgi:hypothetical protein
LKTQKNIVYEWHLAFEVRNDPRRKHMHLHQATLEDDIGVGDQAAQQMGHDLTESLPTRWYVGYVVGRHDIVSVTLLDWRGRDLLEVGR